MKECCTQFLDILKKTLRKRSLKQDSSLETPLKRCLGTVHLTFYSVAHMAGAGIYVLTGHLIKNDAGPSAFLSYILGAISALFTAFCYAEFATLIPRAGSCYTYTYIILGELPAFIIGWTMLADSLIGIATVAKGFSATIDLLSGGAVTNWTFNHFGHLSTNATHGDVLGTHLDLIGFGFILLLVLIVLTGAQSNLSLNILLTTIQVICLFVVAIACFVYGRKENWTVEGGFFPNGFQGVILGASVAVYAFAGFDALANACEETINPRKSVPIALFSSLAVITCLYVLASLGLSYLVPRSHLSIASPYVGGFLEMHQPVFTVIAAVGTLLATGATKIVAMYAVPRMIFTMASDGLFFKQLAYVSSGTRVPYVALVCNGLISATLALLVNIKSLADFVSLGILFSYSTIGINLILLRYTHSEAQSPEVQCHGENHSGDSDSVESLLDSSKPHLRDFFSKINLFRDHLRNKEAFYCVFVIHLIVNLILSLLIVRTDLTSPWSWAFIAIACVANFVTFFLLCIYKPSESDISFTAPLMPLTPVITIIVNLVLIVKLPWLTWVRFVIWTMLGLPVYLFYGIRNSKVDRHVKNPEQYNKVVTDDKYAQEIELKTESIDNT